MTLGEKIRTERKLIGLTQEELADKLCVSRQAIQKWESDNGVPSIENLKAISQLFHVSIDSLVADYKAPIQEEETVEVAKAEPQEEEVREKTKFCPKCGTENFETAKYCKRCSYCFLPQRVVPQATPTEAVQAESVQPESPQKAKRKKKLKIILPLVAFSLVAVVVIGTFIPTFIEMSNKPQIDETGVVYEYEKKTKTYTLTSIGSNEDKDFVTPSEFKGKPVTRISSYAFSNAKIESVTIGDNITTIGERAFYCCFELKAVSLGDGVTEIAHGTFENCNQLKTISLGDSVTTIGDYAFFSCSKLKALSIGNSVTKIGSSAFYNCDKLESISMGDSVTAIGDSAFDKCTKLESVSIGSGVKEIGDFAFANCIRLNDITYNGTFAEWYAIPRNQGYWDTNTANFTVTCTDGTTGKAQEVDWLQYTCDFDEDTDTYTIKSFQFAGVDNYLSEVKTLNVPASYHGKPITTIGERAFFYFTEELPVIIPEGVTEIEEYAFAYSKVIEVEIPKSVTSIGKRIFQQCKWGLKIIYSGTVEEWKAINKYPYENQTTGESRSVICSDGTIEWGAQ